MDDQTTTASPLSQLVVERSLLLGYMFGVPTGYLVILTARFLWNGYTSTVSAERDLLLLVAILMVPILWIATAIPFIVVRKLSGPRCFASPGRAVVSSLIVALLDLPFIAAAIRLFDVEGGLPPYPQQIVEIVSYNIQFVGSAAAISGLTYWLIEFASFPRIRGYLSDSRSLPWTGERVSRRAGLAVAALLALAMVVEALHWRWRPVIQQSSATPKVTFVREWQSRGAKSYFLAWSTDQSRLTSSGGANVTVQNSTGNTVSERSFPNRLSVFGAVANDRYLVAPAALLDRSGTAFTVVDIATGELAFREPDPDPGGPGRVRSDVTLAMSADGSRLALGYSWTRPGQPIRIYDTRTWHRISAIDAAGDPKLGTSAIALSPDGALIAFGKEDKLVVANSASGQIILETPGWPGHIAFNAAGDLIAANMTEYLKTHNPRSPLRETSTLRIYRVADGTEMVSRNSVADLVWDPRGRFIAFTIDWKHIGLWNPRMPTVPDTTMEVPPFTGPLAMSPDGSCLAAVTGDVISFFRIGDGPAGPGGPSACD